MSWEILVGILLVASVLAWRQWHAPSPYRGRSCTGGAWRRAFPDAPKESIRHFLLCFTDGMAFSPKAKLKFHPNDQVLDVYRAIYGGRTPWGDAMECETFLENVGREFGIRTEELLVAWHREVTLGELFAFVTARPGASAHAAKRRG